MKLARIGVLLDEKASSQHWKYGLNVFQGYIGEILSHAGIGFEWVTEPHHIMDGSYDVVLVGLTAEDEHTANILWKFTERGGIVISYAGINMMAKKLGCYKSTSTGVGYASLQQFVNVETHLRYLRAVPWKQDNVEGSVTENGMLYDLKPDGDEMVAALQSFSVGKGSIERWSVDIVETIVKMQQGNEPVLEDGAPAPDGTGPVDDGFLKADDAISMDWDWDRKTTETGARYFACPYADYWREVLIGHMLRCVIKQGKTLPIIDIWPEDTPHVAMISHDSDLNVDATAETTLDALKECNIHSTWCMIKPGYSEAIYERIKSDGHELAFHYNANIKQGGSWSANEFSRQFKWLQYAIGEDKVFSNKNHYTRFEGWGELFEWCETYGIESDQSRGPSKKGNVGFPFGTCHPYFPIAWMNEQNRMYDVLELGFLTQDIPDWVDFSVVEPFLQQVKKVNGVAHFLFHQSRIHRKPEVRESLLKVVHTAEQHGFTFWTGKQVNTWERARRDAHVMVILTDGIVKIRASKMIEKAAVWLPVLDDTHISNQGTTMKYGVHCKKATIEVT